MKLTCVRQRRKRETCGPGDSLGRRLRACRGRGALQIDQVFDSSAEGLQLVQVVHDLGTGPIGGADEFAADYTIFVDDVGFGEFERSIKRVG